MILRERERLLADASLQGLDWCRAWSDAVAAWVAGLYADVFGDRQGVCLLAVGGTGRREMAPRSDIDLMVVHDKKATKVVEQEVGRLWYPIWDTGLSLGHAVRSSRTKLADDELETATALLSGRCLAGDAELAAATLHDCRAAWAAGALRWLPRLRAAELERHRAAGEVAFLLEPGLKDGRGGLRDGQALEWVAASGVTSPADIGLGSGADAVHAAYGTLVHVRVALHRTSVNPGDVLHLEDQDGVAAAAGYRDADLLMAAVSSAARTIAWHSDRIWHSVDRLAAPARPDRPLASGVTLRAGEIELDATTSPAADPTLVLQVALAAARTETPIAVPTLERLGAETPAWPDPWPVGATDELVALLLEGERAIPVLETLDQCDLVTRILPEWEPVRSRPQRNAYHRFTVDRHLWEATAQASLLADRVARADLLVIGALLHDLGKGYPGDHTDRGIELVRVIGPRMGFNDADVQTLDAMVRHHLLLPDVATRRDLRDDGTIALVAEAVQTVERLELLHALTEADSLATGPSAWSPWKAELVEELVDRTRRFLGGEPRSVGPAWAVFPTADVLELMGAGEPAVVVDAQHVVVVTPDAPGTFARVAGVLALHGIDVVGARAHSDEQGMAASQFRLGEAQHPVEWQRVELDVRRALRGELALRARLAERARTYRRRRRVEAATLATPSVVFDDGASSNATVIEVRAPDSVGLLHRVAAALSDTGLDIRHATVQTIGPLVVDTFYVRTAGGEKLTDPFHRAEVERAVLHAVASTT
jgi:[protein-PII] uridylyltransferase